MPLDIPTLSLCSLLCPEALSHVPVFFAVWQQGWAISPWPLRANIGVSAGHHAGGEVVLWKAHREGMKGEKMPPSLPTLLQSATTHFFPLQRFIFIISCIWVFCLHGCLCTRCVPSSQRGQKKVLDLLGPELQTVVSHHVNAGNCTRLSERSVSALNH